MTVEPKLSALREKMSERKLQAYIVPDADPHQSEYVSERWKARTWLSGFTGSAGTVVVTRDSSGLWTDFRYYIQAEKELSGSGIDLYKVGEKGVPTTHAWLAENLSRGESVGICGEFFSMKDVKKLEKTLGEKGISLVTTGDLIDEIWEGRPGASLEPVFLHDEVFSGKSCSEKISDIRDEMKKKGGNSYLVATLDDIAWIFNIRGRDVPFNPVASAYALISENMAALFIESPKVPEDVSAYLRDNGVSLLPYDSLCSFLEKLGSGDTLLVSPDTTNQKVASCIPEACTVREVDNIAAALKSIKNDAEIAGASRALVRDGAAMAEFLCWLEKSVPGAGVSEISAGEKLLELRSKQENFVGESFGIISAFGPHGAMCHYSADDSSDCMLEENMLYLVDSGGQYLDGTTDITRTVVMGEATKELKTDFTLVLKGHIALATAEFPEGTRGVQLDILARKALWDHGINYGHGTGHGVGSFLNVHEGPQSISPRLIDVPLKEGMLISNEPGVYRDGEYGIRTENLILVKKGRKTEFGQFFCFETLTLCPMDKKLIRKDLLTEKERMWINDYHRRVYEKISPLVDNEVGTWLRNATAEL